MRGFKVQVGILRQNTDDKPGGTRGGTWDGRWWLCWLLSPR
jgi:hypothetical protein